MNVLLFFYRNLLFKNKEKRLDIENLKKLITIFLGNGVTCYNGAVMVMADKARNLSFLFLRNGVACDNGAVMALADKAQNLSSLYLGNGVRCDYIVVMALASNTVVLDSIVFGNYVSLGANFSCKTQARSFYLVRTVH